MLNGSNEVLRVLDLDPRLWDEWLDCAPHDLFHTAPYHQLQSRELGANAYLAVYGNREKFFALPYLLTPACISGQKISSELMEVSSVYGYGGPLAYGCQGDRDFLSEAWRAVCGYWTEQKAVSAFIRFHPLLGNASFLEDKTTQPQADRPAGNVLRVGNTVAIDLSKTEDTIWYGYQKQIRQAVRRCASEGIIISEDASWEHLEHFIAIYYKTMERNNAGEFYYFRLDYLRNLKTYLGDHARLMLACFRDTVVSAAILLEHRRVVNLHLLATDNRHLHLSPSKAIIHAAQQWARARGNNIFHLGGGRGGRDNESLFQFKAAFSGNLFPFYVGRWILNQAAYTELTEHRKTQADGSGSMQLDASYFPAYRAPWLKVCDGRSHPCADQGSA